MAANLDTRDALQLYLAEIARYPLLSRADEVRLAKRVAEGDNAARQRMIESNLRLVVTIARDYTGRGLELLDLVQEGTLGLMKAVDRYDWRRGTKFSSYAAWWIRNGIFQALTATARPVRLPESVVERIAAIHRAETALAPRLGHLPTNAEIAVELGLTVEQVLNARAASKPVASLDDDAGDEGRAGYLVADPAAVDPLQPLVDEAAENALSATLAQLSDRARRVLELRFGLHDGVAHTVEAVAQELGVTRERVRQIELRALQTLEPAARLAGVAEAA